MSHTHKHLQLILNYLEHYLFNIKTLIKGRQLLLHYCHYIINANQISAMMHICDSACYALTTNIEWQY